VAEYYARRRADCSIPTPELNHRLRPSLGTPKGATVMPKTRRRTRKTYTPTQRKAILTAAAREGLTALDVRKRFGVTPVTYYSWRKKTGIAGRRNRIATRSNAPIGTGFASALRTEVRAKIQAVLPSIVKSEVSDYMDSLFGTRRGRRRL
jgi:transposase-like protein